MSPPLADAWENLRAALSGTPKPITEGTSPGSPPLNAEVPELGTAPHNATEPFSSRSTATPAAPSGPEFPAFDESPGSSKGVLPDVIEIPELPPPPKPVLKPLADFASSSEPHIPSSAPTAPPPFPALWNEDTSKSPVPFIQRTADSPPPNPDPQANIHPNPIHGATPGDPANGPVPPRERKSFLDWLRE